MSHSRRAFAQTAGAAMAGVGVAATRETLALHGGPKAVTFPTVEQSALFRWPRYGAAEKNALHELIDSGKFYEELPLFEKWKEYTRSPFVKAHMNCSSALTSMYFALDLPPGSEIMVPSYTFFATCLAMRFFAYVPVFIDVDPNTVCFDLEDARRKLTPRTRALIPARRLRAGSGPSPWRIPRCGPSRRAIPMSASPARRRMQGRMMGTWGAMGAYSFQLSKVMPTVEGGMGMYQTREYFERASAFGHYEDPAKFPADSPVRQYKGTGFGQKYRMHPLAAAIARQQLRALDERSGVVGDNIRKLNDRLILLPGLREPRCRPDQKRAYYYGNMLLLDSAKADFSRDALLKAFRAEGVRASMWDYPEQHRLKIYSEAKWWHHPPVIPPSMPGNARVNATHIFLPLMHGNAPELIDQYVKAFEKVWAHRGELASA